MSRRARGFKSMQEGAAAGGSVKEEGLPATATYLAGTCQ